ncbi:hypothetical protein [Anaerosolibacter sp.]|uniref:hypothetical protein n=1 Tax=Anaerosolibacter sp. TaxID=1872527 RepID=UPI0039EEE24C
MAKYGVTDIDKGWGRIIKELKTLEGKKVDIGVQSGSGTTEDGFDLAGLAAVHEFGDIIYVPPSHKTSYHKVKKDGSFKPGFSKKSKANFAMRSQSKGHYIKIPARPFFRRTFDAGGKEEISAFIDKLFGQLLNRNLTADNMLKRVGLMYEKMSRKKLTEGPWKPNAPSTVKKKGSSRPLIDTGRLRASIRYIIGR